MSGEKHRYIDRSRTVYYSVMSSRRNDADEEPETQQANSDDCTCCTKSYEKWDSLKPGWKIGICVSVWVLAAFLALAAIIIALVVHFEVPT